MTRRVRAVRAPGVALALALALAAGAACRRAAETPAAGDASKGAHIVARSGLAMGSELTLLAWTADEDVANRSFDAVFKEFDRLDLLDNHISRGKPPLA